MIWFIEEKLLFYYFYLVIDVIEKSLEEEMLEELSMLLEIGILDELELSLEVLLEFVFPVQANKVISDIIANRVSFIFIGPPFPISTIINQNLTYIKK